MADEGGWKLRGALGARAVGGAKNEASNATGVGGDDTNNSAAGSGAAYLFLVP
ncbi:MAG: hypothetical protein U0172_13855 [Nitrospiraceae bacterium]